MDGQNGSATEMVSEGSDAVHQQRADGLQFGNTHGFRAQSSMEEVISLIRELVCEVDKWGGRLEVFGGDVLHAFDNLRPEVLAGVLQDRGVSPHSVAVLHREMVGG